MMPIRPASERLASLLTSVRDDQLYAPTPCQIPVAALLDHVQNLARAFRAVAEKTVDAWVTSPPKPDAEHLGEGWRERVPRLLREMVDAWDAPGSLEGPTQVGTQQMPGETAAVIALDEVVLHSWDLAVATGQPYEPPEAWLQPLLPFLEHVAEPAMAAAREGLFGPPLPVRKEAPVFEKVLCLAGRDPRWSPASADWTGDDAPVSLSPRLRLRTSAQPATSAANPNPAGNSGTAAGGNEAVPSTSV
jgi:uncharacterized protein (TIGR03086 family)